MPLRLRPNSELGRASQVSLLLNLHLNSQLGRRGFWHPRPKAERSPFFSVLCHRFHSKHVSITRRNARIFLVEKSEFSGYTFMYFHTFWGLGVPPEASWSHLPKRYATNLQKAPNSSIFSLNFGGHFDVFWHSKNRFPGGIFSTLFVIMVSPGPPK